MLLLQLVILRSVAGSGSWIIVRILILTIVYFEYDVVLQEYELGLGLGDIPGAYSMFIPHVLGQYGRYGVRGRLA